MRIGSQNSSKAIVVEENKNKDERRFIARVFRNKADGKWYTSTDKRGLVVYLRKKPILGERIKIKSVSHNSATAEIVLVHKVKEC
jgi:hypothetical protein